MRSHFPFFHYFNNAPVPLCHYSSNVSSFYRFLSPRDTRGSHLGREFGMRNHNMCLACPPSPHFSSLPFLFPHFPSLLLPTPLFPTLPSFIFFPLFCLCSMASPPSLSHVSLYNFLSSSSMFIPPPPPPPPPPRPPSHTYVHLPPQAPTSCCTTF